MLKRMIRLSFFGSVLVATLSLSIESAVAQATFIEYPGHPQTYGDHFVNADWDGLGAVTVELQTDESILHNDGMGQSQRTARNSLNYTAPSAASNPQNYDDLALIDQYGDRLPLLQQMSANGTSTLVYSFASLPRNGFDLFVTDIDSSDDVSVRAFGPNDAPIDMTTWTLATEGDLSLYKNTGTVFSDIVAPTPTTVFSADRIDLNAVDPVNYNRSYSVLRSPFNPTIERVEIEFTGIQNSASRDSPNTGSHVYLAISTLPLPLGDYDGNQIVDMDDYDVWTSNFGSTSMLDADGNRDGIVDAADFTIWRDALDATAVPEPTTLLPLLLIGALRKRRPTNLKRSQS